MSTRTPAGWLMTANVTRCLVPGICTCDEARGERLRRLEDERLYAVVQHIREIQRDDTGEVTPATTQPTAA